MPRGSKVARKIRSSRGPGDEANPVPDLSPVYGGRSQGSENRFRDRRLEGWGFSKCPPVRTVWKGGDLVNVHRTQVWMGGDLVNAYPCVLFGRVEI